MTTHNLENAEIRGLNIKLILLYTTMLLGGAGAWYNLKIQIHDASNINQSDNRTQDISIQALQQQLEQIRVDQRLQNTAITRQDIELERIKEKLGMQ